MITNIPDRERALQAQVDALTEELASVEASNRIRGDELARLRDEMSKMQQHATPPADIISRAVSNAKYWMDRAEHAEAELERLRAVPMENIRRAVARGWYHPENAHKEMDVELESAIADEIAELYAAPPAQPAEPDMRHPKIQALIGSMARCQIELQLVEQLLEDPNFEATSMDMEHWGPMHDKLKAILVAAAQPAPAQPADPVQRLSDEQIDAVTRDKFGTSLLGAEIAMHREYGRAIESALQTKATK